MGAILQENGDALLLESGDRLLTEAGVTAISIPGASMKARPARGRAQALAAIKANQRLAAAPSAAELEQLIDVNAVVASRTRQASAEKSSEVAIAGATRTAARPSRATLKNTVDLVATGEAVTSPVSFAALAVGAVLVFDVPIERRMRAPRDPRAPRAAQRVSWMRAAKRRSWLRFK